MSYIGKTPTSVPLTSSDITDSIISLPKLTDGTDGNLISYDASGNPVAVATGTDGQVLTSTGAGSPPVFETLPAGGVNTPAFLAFRSGANQTISASTETVVQFNSENFDSDGDYDTATYRFTPQVAGKYFLFASVQFTGSMGNDSGYYSVIRKNGSNISIDERFCYEAISLSVSTTPHTIGTANGTTDYFDVVARFTSGTPAIRTGIAFTFFGGFKIIE